MRISQNYSDTWPDIARVEEVQAAMIYHDHGKFNVFQFSVKYKTKFIFRLMPGGPRGRGGATRQTTSCRSDTRGATTIFRGTHNFTIFEKASTKIYQDTMLVYIWHMVSPPESRDLLQI